MHILCHIHYNTERRSFLFVAVTLHDDMEMFSHQKPEMQSFDYFELEKLSSCQWLHTPWHSCDAIVML